MQPIGDYLSAEGFKQETYKGVLAWRKGNGILTGPQYVIISYGPDFVQVEAFLKFAILPGVYAGEMGANNGFVGAIPKSMLLRRISTIEQYIYSLWQQPHAPSPSAL